MNVFAEWEIVEYRDIELSSEMGGEFLVSGVYSVPLGRNKQIIVVFENSADDIDAAQRISNNIDAAIKNDSVLIICYPESWCERILQFIERATGCLVTTARRAPKRVVSYIDHFVDQDHFDLSQSSFRIRKLECSGEISMKAIGVSNTFNYVDVYLYDYIETTSRLELIDNMRNDKEPPIVSDKPTQMADRIASAVSEMIERSGLTPDEVQSVGIATSGTIAPDQQTLVRAGLFRASNLPIARIVSETTGISDVWCINDVNARLYAELRLGVARNAQHVLYIFADWGVGGAIAANGEIYKGYRNIAGEFGHMKVAAQSGAMCTCGQSGCVEAIASRRAILQQLLYLVGGNYDTVLVGRIHNLTRESNDINNLKAITSMELQQAYESGDMLTRDVLDDAADALGRGISSAVNLLNPEMVILGGDLPETIEFYFNTATKSARTYSLRSSIEGVHLERPNLRGGRAEAEGAAIFAVDASMPTT